MVRDMKTGYLYRNVMGTFQFLKMNLTCADSAKPKVQLNFFNAYGYTYTSSVIGLFRPSSSGSVYVPGHIVKRTGNYWEEMSQKKKKTDVDIQSVEMYINSPSAKVGAPTRNIFGYKR